MLILAGRCPHGAVSARSPGHRRIIHVMAFCSWRNSDPGGKLITRRETTMPLCFVTASFFAAPAQFGAPTADASFLVPQLSPINDPPYRPAARGIVEGAHAERAQVETLLSGSNLSDIAAIAMSRDVCSAFLGLNGLSIHPLAILLAH